MRLNLTKYYSEINNLLKIDNNIKKISQTANLFKKCNAKGGRVVLEMVVVHQLQTMFQ